MGGGGESQTQESQTCSAPGAATGQLCDLGEGTSL